MKKITASLKLSVPLDVAVRGNGYITEMYIRPGTSKANFELKLIGAISNWKGELKKPGVYTLSATAKLTKFYGPFRKGTSSTNR